MSVAITATVQDIYPPRVLVSVTGITAGNDVDVYRQVASNRVLLRSGRSLDVTDPNFVVVDAELPFGVPVRYVAVINGATEYAEGPDTYELPGGKVVVSDAITGLAAEVVILSWDRKVFPMNSTVFNIGGRNLATVDSPKQWTGDIEFYTEHWSDYQQLIQVLTSATLGVVQMRQPGPYMGVDAYFVVLGLEENRFSQDGSDERRTTVVSAAEVNPWPALFETRSFTLQDIANRYDGQTLADIAADFGSLLEIASEDWS